MCKTENVAMDNRLVHDMNLVTHNMLCCDFVVILGIINHLPNDKILDGSKFKVIADDNY